MKKMFGSISFFVLYYPVILGCHLISYPKKSVFSKKANEINTPEITQSAVFTGSNTTKPKQKKISAFSRLELKNLFGSIK